MPMSYYSGFFYLTSGAGPTARCAGPGFICANCKWG